MPENELTIHELGALENMTRDREFYRRRDDTWRFAHEETDLIESALVKLRALARLRHASTLRRDLDG